MKIRPPLPGIGAATVEERTWAGTLCAFPGECSPGSRVAGVFVAPLPPGFSDRGSSAAPINAMAAPMGAEFPSETSILRSVPLAKASISMLTLSVSTSASISPFFTGSPSFLIQRRILPSSIVSPSPSYPRTRPAGTMAFTASIISLFLGRAARSRAFEYGIGTSAPVTCWIGASM